jgi:hypothetical protein
MHFLDTLSRQERLPDDLHGQETISRLVNAATPAFAGMPKKASELF